MLPGDHPHEIRYHATISTLTLVLVTIGCAFFYQPLVLFIMKPYNVARTDVKTANPEANLQLVNTGVTGPSILGIVILIVCGLIITISMRLYQIWASAAPGLLAEERKHMLYFMAAGIPLSLVGCAMGHQAWSKGIAVMLSFTPQDLGIMNYQDMAEFVTLELKIVLIFGVSFLLPVIVVALDLLNVVRGHQLKGQCKGVFFGSFVLVTVAIPLADPFTILCVAVPMIPLLYFFGIVCRGLDKRRGIVAAEKEQFNTDVDDDK